MRKVIVVRVVNGKQENRQNDAPKTVSHEAHIVMGDLMGLTIHNNRLADITTKVVSMGKEFNPAKAIRLMESLVKQDMECKLLASRLYKSPDFSSDCEEYHVIADLLKNVSEMIQDLDNRFMESLDLDYDDEVDSTEPDEEDDDEDDDDFDEMQEDLERMCSEASQRESEIERVLGFDDARFDAQKAMGLLKTCNSLVNDMNAFIETVAHMQDSHMKILAEATLHNLSVSIEKLRQRIRDTI